MRLESLANELLLDLFTYLHSIDLFRSFFGLNLRFNHLLFHHFQFYSLDLRSISKEHFDDLCHRYLPSFSDRLIALILSDDDETPDVPVRLLRCSSGFTLDRFSHLQSLSLFNISSFDILYDIICQCQSLVYLTHLTIISKYHYWKKNENVDNINKRNDLWKKIWSLSKLRQCHLDGIETDENTILTLPTTSSLIEHLSLKNISHSLRCLSHLLHCTPNLHHLRTTIYSYSSNDHMVSMNSSLTSMTLVFGGSLQSLTDLFKNLSHLIHLTITTLRIHLDGHVWQHLIKTYLCRMKRFKMIMEMDYREDHNDIDDIVDELLLTYQSSFWCEEHKWYVRCHWNQSDPYKCVILYTLPYGLNYFDYTNKSSTKSTCNYQQEKTEHYLSYDKVQRVDCASIETVILDNFHIFPVRFRNLCFLHICLPFVDEHFLLHFPSFDHLKSLYVCIYKSSGYDQLQTIFDRCRSSCLCSFEFESLLKKCLSTKLFELRTKQLIRRIDLLNSRNDRKYYHSKEECLMIIHSSSSLMIGCEVLLIGVKNRTSIMNLIEELSNLRMLIVECQDDNDELVEWLKEYLPSTYVIRRDPQYISRVQVWINRETKSKRFLSDRSISTLNPTHKISQFVRSSFRQLFFDE